MECNTYGESIEGWLLSSSEEFRRKIEGRFFEAISKTIRRVYSVVSSKIRGLCRILDSVRIKKITMG